MTAVNAVFTCTQRKIGGVLPANRIARFKGTGATRAECWLQHLQGAHASAVPASDIYCGEHWDAVRGLLTDRKNSKYSVWVASAGYGLISASSPIVSYGATFQPGTPDSVVKGHTAASDAADWWSLLSAWAGPSPGAPRSLYALAKQWPKTPLLVAAAPTYLHALLPDLQKAMRALARPDLLTVVTSRTAVPDDIARHVVWSDARLRARFGGSCISLNARLLVEAVSTMKNTSLRASILRPRYAAIIEELEKPVTEKRQQIDDEQVEKFIRAELKANPKAKHSPLLRKLRTEMKLQCEQSRFKALFLKVAGTSHGA